MWWCQGVTGKDVLQELVKGYCEEYQDLTEEEKTELLLKFSEHKETRTSGIWISTKLKIIDITQTLKAVESKVSPWCILFLLADMVYI